MKPEIICPYCKSEEVKERPGLYSEKPVAPEMNHASSVKKYKIYRCLECGREFEEEREK